MENNEDHILVTKHESVKTYLIEEGIVPADIQIVSYINENFAKDKHIYGIVPLNIAAVAKSYTEVKITLNKNQMAKDLTFDELKPLVKYVCTYDVKQVKKYK